jgi:hypothetical protein
MAFVEKLVRLIYKIFAIILLLAISQLTVGIFGLTIGVLLFIYILVDSYLLGLQIGVSKFHTSVALMPANLL